MSQVKKHLAVVQADHGGDLEQACVHCGACCHARASVNGTQVLVRGLRCKFLRVDGEGQSRCAVYAERHARAPWCKSLEVAIEKSLLPGPCPYVASLPAYTGPAILGELQYRLVEEQIRHSLSSQPCPEWADPGEWKAYVEGVIQ